MNRSMVFVGLATIIYVAGCSQTIDSCDDLKGTITHTSTEITGIESVAVLRRNANLNTVQAVDQLNGTEFSNLIIELELSWIAEQERLDAPNTFLQSFLDWFISPAMACSLVPYYEDYQPPVSSLQIFSDTDINTAYVAGSDLSALFSVPGMMGQSISLLEASNSGSLLSSRSYALEPAWRENQLVSQPATPNTHTFTIRIAYGDGRSFEVQTAAVLLSGI